MEIEECCSLHGREHQIGNSKNKGQAVAAQLEPGQGKNRDGAQSNNNSLENEERFGTAINQVEQRNGNENGLDMNTQAVNSPRPVGLKKWAAIERMPNSLVKISQVH